MGQSRYVDRQAAVREYVQRLTLLDDLFMGAVFEDARCVETVLQVIMGKPDLRVEEARVKHDLINLLGKSTQVDVLAIDGTGRQYDIEVQRSPYGAVPRRARYYGAMLDAKTLEKGTVFGDLPEAYVIFITETDVLGAGRALYHIDRRVCETGAAFDDGLHVLYVNCACADDGSPLGDLAHDFACADPNQMRYNVLKERSSRLKGDGEEGAMMSESVERLIAEFKDDLIAEGLEEGLQKGREEGIQEGIERGLQEGRETATLEIARRMLEQGVFSRDQIALCTGLSPDVVAALVAD